MVSLFLTAPEGLGVAIPSTNTEDNDFEFPSSSLLSIEPDETETFADLTIFGDDLPEATEAAQLRLSLPTDTESPGFETLAQYPSFFIIIEDDDSELLLVIQSSDNYNANFSGFLIGFENSSYTVDEGDSNFGFQFLEVCVRMLEPSDDTPLGSVIINYGVEIVPGSAGIVCRDAYYITVYCILFDSQERMTIMMNFPSLYSLSTQFAGVASES